MSEPLGAGLEEPPDRNGAFPRLTEDQRARLRAVGEVRPVHEPVSGDRRPEGSPTLPAVPAPLLAALSPREREVLDAMADGDSNADPYRLYLDNSHYFWSNTASMNLPIR